MDHFLERIYLEQAKQECEACFTSIKMFNAALARKDADDLFSQAMALVHRAAAASRIFWPPKNGHKYTSPRAQRRGEALRNSLQLPEKHPVRARTLRDHFEHFDERLDDWAERSKNRNIIGKLLGPRGAIGGDAIQDEDIIHHYDPDTKIYAFRGEKFDIQELASGLNDLYGRVTIRLVELEKK